MKVKNKNSVWLRWVVLAVIMFLAVNYCIYGISYADSKNKIPPSYIHADAHRAYWEFGTDKFQCFGNTSTEKSDDILRWDEDWYNYEVNGLYLTFCDKSKIKVHYGTDYSTNHWWQPHDLNGVCLSYCFYIETYDDNGISLWNTSNFCGEVDNWKSELRRDRVEGNNDHETFDLSGYDCFYSRFNDIYHDGIIKSLNDARVDTKDKTLKQLVEDKKVKICLVKVEMFSL